MTTAYQLILALLLAFNSMETPQSDLEQFAAALARYQHGTHGLDGRIVEVLGVAYVESTFRPLGRPNPSGCVCWLQQQCGAKHKKPSCRRMARAGVCVAGWFADRKMWREQCDSWYLGTYRYGWSCCKGGKWWKRHRHDPGRRWRTDAECRGYAGRVHAAERKFRRWLRKREAE